jgi:hypothetical protein
MARALTAEELNERLQYGDLLLLRRERRGSRREDNHVMGASL